MSQSAETTCLRNLASRAQLAAGHVASAYLASPEPSWSDELKELHRSLVEMIEGLLHAMLARGVSPAEAREAVQGMDEPAARRSFADCIGLAVRSIEALEEGLSEVVTEAGATASSILDLAAIYLLQLRAETRVLAVFISTQEGPITRPPPLAAPT